MTNEIFPCLWFDGDGKAAADFYCDIFGGKITTDTQMVINTELFGQKIMILNAGPQFQKNASISFTVLCEDADELKRYWENLVDGGKVLLELAEQPWSVLYGWVRDKFGVTWQLSINQKKEVQRIVPTLMFLHENNGKAAEAMIFYTNIFPNSKIGSILKYGDGIAPDPNEKPENIQHAHFEIDGYSLFCLDYSYDHPFDFNEGISLVVMTDTQEQTDHLWNNLTADGGRELMCGWLKDKYGVSWQIVPKKLLQLMNGEDHEKGAKVMQAMMKMQKIIISDLETAYNS